MTNMTANEAAVIRSIACNSYSSANYSAPRTFDYASDEVWADCINDSGIPSGVEGKSLSGVVSSLNSKGFARSSGIGRDACVRITEAGWNAMIAHYGSLESAFVGIKFVDER